MDLTSLKIINPWWEDQQAIREDPHLQAVLGKPYYFDNPVKKKLALKTAATYVLRGGRQVGKTTLLKEKILEAIESGGVLPDHCLFLSCEALENFSGLQKLLTDWIRSRVSAKLLICLDEVTFIPEWQRALLWLINAGLLRNAVTLVTGSNARDLKLSAERFPGRQVSEAKIFPLSPFDYARLDCFAGKEPSDLLKIYLRVGGYPHAIRDFHEMGRVSDETCETYANWIFGDAHRFNLNREILEHLLYRIFETSGSQVTWQRLIEKSAVKSHETAASYIEHLELAFLCHVLPCFDPDRGMAASRKAKKLYFVDPLLYAVVGGYLRGVRNVDRWWLEALSDPRFQGQIFESVAVGTVARARENLYFWYSSTLKREVDILIRRGDTVQLYEVKSKPEPVRRALGREVRLVTPDSYWKDFNPAEFS